MLCVGPRRAGLGKVDNLALVGLITIPSHYQSKGHFLLCPASFKLSFRNIGPSESDSSVSLSSRVFFFLILSLPEGSKYAARAS